MTALHHLPRTLLEPSATNPRKHFDPERQAELRASIEQHGVLQPLIVRPIAGRDGSGQPLFEIISG
jgi:ParB family chromosome partitioning protein